MLKCSTDYVSITCQTLFCVWRIQRLQKELVEDTKITPLDSAPKSNKTKSYYPYVSQRTVGEINSKKINIAFHLIGGILMLMLFKYFQRVSLGGFSPSNKTAIWLTSCKMRCVDCEMPAGFNGIKVGRMCVLESMT